MKPSFRKATAAALAILALACILLGNLFDRWVDDLQESRAERRLYSLSKEGLSGLREATDSLQTLFTDLQSKVDGISRRGRPTPATMRELAKEHNVQLRQLERINATEQSLSTTSGYRVAMLGTAGAVLRFQNDFESKFNFDLKSVSLQAGNTDGTRVLLTLHIETEEL